MKYVIIYNDFTSELSYTEWCKIPQLINLRLCTLLQYTNPVNLRF